MDSAEPPGLALRRTRGVAALLYLNVPPQGAFALGLADRPKPWLRHSRVLSRSGDQNSCFLLMFMFWPETWGRRVLARSAASPCPARISRGTRGHPRTSGDPLPRVSTPVWACPPDNHTGTPSAAVAARPPPARPRRRPKPGRAPERSRRGRREGPRVRLGRSAAPRARPPPPHAPRAAPAESSWAVGAGGARPPGSAFRDACWTLVAVPPDSRRSQSQPREAPAEEAPQVPLPLCRPPAPSLPSRPIP